MKIGRTRGFTTQRAAKHKYGAIRTEVDGITFASKAEARRYSELKMLQKRGEIRNLVVQPKYDLFAGPRPDAKEMLLRKICTYIADFQYESDREIAGFWLTCVEDVKGVLTPIYRLKKKLMRACYGIEITEITRS